MNSRKFGNVVVVALTVAIFLTCSTLLHAAEPAYPNKTITITVPMVAGGQFDLGARVLAEFMERELKQPVVVMNKPGAAGTVGGYSVVSAKPDGYNLGYFHNSAAVPEVYTYFYSAPYSSADLIPVCRVHQLLNVITAREDAPYNNLKEFVEYARKNPGVKYAHNGKASVQYVVMSTIAKAENLNLVDVPYDGDGAILPALLGGHVPIGLPAYAVIKSHLQAKKLKMLATCTEQRSSFTPDTPSIVEQGYKLPYVVSVSLFAPKKTPDAILKRIDEVVRKIVADKEFQKKTLHMDMAIAHLDSAGLQAELGKFKTNVGAFFKEQGLVKQ